MPAVLLTTCASSPTHLSLLPLLLRSWFRFSQPFGLSGCWAEVSIILLPVGHHIWHVIWSLARMLGLRIIYLIYSLPLDGPTSAQCVCFCGLPRLCWLPSQITGYLSTAHPVIKGMIHLKMKFEFNIYSCLSSKPGWFSFKGTEYEMSCSLTFSLTDLYQFFFVSDCWYEVYIFICKRW